MTPPKRPPPPSPLRKGAAPRPPAPAPSADPAQSAAGEPNGNLQHEPGALRPLFIAGGVGLALLATSGIALALLFALRPPVEASYTTAAANQEPNSSTSGSEIPQPGAVTSEEANPIVEPVDPAEPVPPPPSPPLPTAPVKEPDMALATTSNVPIPPATSSPAVEPALAGSANAQPASSSPAPPAAVVSGVALAEVRERGTLLPLPPSQEASRVILANIDVKSPQQCDLTLLGGDELCPPGGTLRLVRQDPAQDERVWTVTLKSTGVLSKEKSLADFRLKNEQLSFQWQKLSGGGVIPALMYCLLRIDAAGEQEICQLGKPLTAAPLPMKLADRWTIEAEIPGVSLGSAALRAEPLAIDFPNVSIPASATLAPGQTTTFKVSGNATGELAVDLELEFRLEQKDDKWQLTVIPYATPPVVGKSARAPVRGVVAAVQIKRRMGELTKAATTAESQSKALQTQLERLERDEQTLNTAIPMNANQRVMISQQLQQVRQQLVLIKPKADEAKEHHESLATAAAWYTDMFALLEELQTQSKLGVRLFRTVGAERVVVAEPDQS